MKGVPATLAGTPPHVGREDAQEVGDGGRRCHTGGLRCGCGNEHRGQRIWARCQRGVGSSDSRREGWGSTGTGHRHCSLKLRWACGSSNARQW